MNYTVTEESFASLNSYWNNPRPNLDWGLFILPMWLEVWWQAFGTDAELHIRAVKQGEQLIGIAPLMVRDKTAYIIGGANVCDYLDFIVAAGMGRDFFTVIFQDLEQKGINKLELMPVRQDSTVLTNLVPIARSRKYDILCNKEDVSLELDLPSIWDEYLTRLAAKYRHEVERKLRRLYEAGKIDYSNIEDTTAVDEAMDIFIRLFSESRKDKAAFMTAQIESFFRSLAKAMAKAGLLRLGILELDRLPIATVMCFDYNNCVYLYNSGYDPRYRSLSAGLLCKVFCIKDSIERGKRKFDFLKGGEEYKYQLGGREIQLHNCQINLRQPNK